MDTTVRIFVGIAFVLLGAWILANPRIGSPRMSPESQQVLDEILIADDWMMFCAGNAEEYTGSFDAWVRMLHIERFHEEFKKARPQDALPTREEIGERFKALRDTHRIKVVDGSLVRVGDGTGEPEVVQSAGLILGPGETMEIQMTLPVIQRAE